jgi:hypothetical protein
MSKYFEKTPAGSRVVEPVRKLVTFRQLNLLEPLPGIGPFDVVFLRNVLIYFEPAAAATSAAASPARCCRTVGWWSGRPRTCSTPARSSCRRRTAGPPSTSPTPCRPAAADRKLAGQVRRMRVSRRDRAGRADRLPGRFRPVRAHA